MNAFQQRWDRTDEQAAREADCERLIEQFLKVGAERQVPPPRARAPMHRQAFTSRPAQKLADPPPHF